MKRHLIVWAVVGVGVAIAPGMSRAEEPRLAPEPIFSNPAPVLAVPGPAMAPNASEEAPARRGPLTRCLNKVGLACWSHHNSLGCSSLKSECVFIFGDCRSFYGEPCLAKPTPPPWAAGNPNEKVKCNCP